MEQPQYLIDTNTVIDYLGERLPASGMAFMNHVFSKLPPVSVITKIEILGFKAPGEYEQLLINFMQDVAVLSLTDDIVAASINIRKNYKAKLPDAIIAATALVHGLTLLTHNLADFKNILDLALMDPYNPHFYTSG
jgi:predicted nucleic acid-binding protein